MIRNYFFLLALLMLTLAGTASTERSIPRVQREIIRDFGQLPVEAPGLLPGKDDGVIRIERRSEQLLRLLSGDPEIDAKSLGFYSDAHFFLELSVRPEHVDQLPFFRISDEMEHRLALPGNRVGHAYAELIGKREEIHNLVLSKESRVFPTERIELKRLDYLLTQYEVVRDIFQLGQSTNSLSQYLTQLIAFLPEGLENYQNQLEGLPFNEEIALKYLSTRETLVRDGPQYRIIPASDASDPRYTTLERTVVDSVDAGLFNPVSMWFAEFYDAYRSEDFPKAQQVLNTIIESTPTAEKVDGDGYTFRFTLLLAKIFKAVAVICALAGIFFGFLALHTGKRAGIIAIILAMIAWGYQLAWLVIHYRTDASVAWFQLPLLLNILGLLPLLGLKSYHPATVFSGVLIAGTIFLFQVQAPTLQIYPEAFAEFPHWILVAIFIWQLTGVLAAGVILQMLIAGALVYRSSRVFEDQHLRLRQLMSVSLPLLRISMLAILLSLTTSVLLFWRTPGWLPVGYLALAPTLAILIQCSIFLQLRWINQINISGLGKNHITLLILALFLVVGLGEATLAYFPDTFVTRFPSLLKSLLFPIGGIVILTLYTLPVANRVASWVRLYRQARKDRGKKEKARPK